MEYTALIVYYPNEICKMECIVNSEHEIDRKREVKK